MRRTALALLLLAGLGASAQAEPRQGEGPVRLSPREAAAAERIRLRDGTVVTRVGDGGIPWLFGFGSVYGKASAREVVDGQTDSILRSTPSNGLVPGQDPK
ncbi:hypothetical protein [Aurantimonas sp. Leaf443]|uniref:hypothetical protein n=1 Tax=Aurantimonas sp. Leaf443 TaxID=1736378 RepID=UPI0007019BCB|nr:hypothetical protein [Aurantimonas sp. Leaf443]KQT86023.1 hypothetical protein ASG48_05395 [Aurantimonas sp. Leaf443]